MNFEAGKEKISKPSKQSGWWRETFGFYACLWLNLFFWPWKSPFSWKVWRRVSTTCAPKQLQMPSNSLWMWMPWRDLGRRDVGAVSSWPGLFAVFFWRDEILPRYTVIQWIIFFQPISGSSDEPISGISQAFWLLLTWALRWTGNPPWIILVWSKITAWETQPFLNRKSAYRHGYFQRYLRICGNLSEYLCVTDIQDLIYIYIYIQYIHVTYLLHMIHILWLTMYYHLYNLHQHIWIAPRRSGSDTDSTTATVGSSSSASGISSSLETSVIQSLKAEGPKYSCVNCSA